jgi:hypothetical protein
VLRSLFLKGFPDEDPDDDLDFDLEREERDDDRVELNDRLVSDPFFDFLDPPLPFFFLPPAEAERGALTTITLCLAAEALLGLEAAPAAETTTSLGLGFDFGFGF